MQTEWLLSLAVTIAIAMDQTEWVTTFASELQSRRPHLLGGAARAIAEALWPNYCALPPVEVARDYDRASDAAASGPPKSRAATGRVLEERRRR